VGTRQDFNYGHPEQPQTGGIPVESVRISGGKVHQGQKRIPRRFAALGFSE
jgi:hypothetical protein